MLMYYFAFFNVEHCDVLVGFVWTLVIGDHIMCMYVKPLKIIELVDSIEYAFSGSRGSIHTVLGTYIFVRDLAKGIWKTLI